MADYKYPDPSYTIAWKISFHMFITNEGNNTLENKLQELLKESKEVKILVGCFHFSAVMELHETLKELYSKNKLSQKHIKILVGLSETNEEKAEAKYEEEDKIEFYDKNTEKEKFVENFVSSMVQSVKEALTDQKTDYKEIESQIKLFTKLLKERIIIIKKTARPNNSKLYLFKTKDSPNTFITGSSNLSREGLVSQHELNAIIQDENAFKKAENYFDKLWKNAALLSNENIERIKHAGLISLKVLTAAKT